MNIECKGCQSFQAMCWAHCQEEDCDGTLNDCVCGALICEMGCDEILHAECAVDDEED